MDAKSARRTRLIAIGASTGGLEALQEVLRPLYGDCPGIVVSQHIPEAFSESFVERIDRCTKLSVQMAEEGARIRPGHVYIAPGGRHLQVMKIGSGFHCHVTAGDRINCHIPSVDLLFKSVAKVGGAVSIGVILTGMGSDGAQGLKLMYDSGSYTLAQDEASSAIWGMPQAAIKLGGVNQVLSLKNIPTKIMSLALG